MEITRLAIDLAKDSFHIYAVGSNNEVLVDKKLNRHKFGLFIENLSPTTLFMESCGGAHYWSRRFTSSGHKVILIAPHHVTPYVGVQKNDRNDARAILEACTRSEAVFVGVKQLWQQDLQSLHRARELKLKQQIALINQIRGLLMEYGVVIPKTHRAFKAQVLLAIESVDNELTMTIRDLCKDLYLDYEFVSQKVEQLDAKIVELASGYDFFKRAKKEIMGVGDLVASNFMASVGDGSHFCSARQVSAWLGLVPRQFSTGGKTRLGRISKHGDSRLRCLVVQGARAAVMAAMRKEHRNQDEEKIVKLYKQKGFNVTSVAVANRNVRRLYAVLKKCV